MMFGHDDHQHNEQNNNQDTVAPQADDMLSSTAPTDNSAPVMPNDDSAGDFIMDDAPVAKDLPPVPPAPGVADDVIVAAPKPVDNNELLRIKQEAIHELAPMVDHLEQKPEEKFRTTMMMIQATDNDKLIPGAYAAAKEISDEKVRAQAYLDIVNEINYFTQASESDKAAA